VTVVTRWPLLLSRTGGWRDTALRLPPGGWKDRLSGNTWEGEVPINSLLAALPVALLVVEAQ
jgi:(1->4)-alpha-D-glucan 1-alpha-D-glucosylmutase